MILCINKFIHVIQKLFTTYLTFKNLCIYYQEQALSICKLIKILSELGVVVHTAIPVLRRPKQLFKANLGYITRNTSKIGGGETTKMKYM